jgi:hypothetical protein
MLMSRYYSLGQYGADVGMHETTEDLGVVIGHWA